MSKSTKRLKTAVAGLIDVSANLHAAVADNGSGIAANAGLAQMVKPLGKVVVPSGRPVDATVAATRTVYPGDMVRWCSEARVDGDALRVAVGGVKVLAAKEILAYGWRGVVIAFLQDGHTKLKTVYIKYGEINLGPTVTLCEDEAVDLVMGVYEDTFAFIFYTSDMGTHYATRAACFDGYAGTVVNGEDLFRAESLDDMPCNLAVSHATEEDWDHQGEHWIRRFCPRAVLCYTRGEAAYLHSAGYKSVGIIYGAEYPLTSVEDADYEAHWGAWGVAWSLDALYITYPRKGKNTTEQALRILGCWSYGNAGPGDLIRFFDHKMATPSSPFGWAVPAVAIYPCRQWDHGTILAHGVSRLSNSGGALKSSLAITTWCAGIRAEDQPQIPDGVERGPETHDLYPHAPTYAVISTAECDAAYNTNIGLVALSDYDQDTTLASYCHETTMYALPITWRECQSVGGNAVALGAFDEFGTVLAVRGFGGIYVYQQDGAVYVKAVKIQSVVIPTDANNAEGVAVRGGSGGTVIPIRKSV